MMDPHGSLKMKNSVLALQRFWKEEDGVTAIEYGLIAALIAVVIIAAVTSVGQNLNVIFNVIANALKNAWVSGKHLERNRSGQLD